MSNYYEKTNDGHLDWREKPAENIYYRFIVNNFGNVHLSGCRYLAEACVLYAQGEHQSKVICSTIAGPEHKNGKAVDRAIRTYVEKLDEQVVAQCLPSVNYITNKAIIAAIVHAVSIGGQHETN